MNKTLKSVLLAVGLVVIFLVVYLFLYRGQVGAPTNLEQTHQKETAPAPDFTGNEEAFKNALNLYIQKKQEGVDMTSGPCLGRVADDWVLDIAHDPRQPIDDKAENQCVDYQDGRVKHFIELDPEGKLIRSE